MTDPQRCPVRSSLTDDPCVLPWGHPAASAERFHKFRAALDTWHPAIGNDPIDDDPFAGMPPTVLGRPASPETPEAGIDVERLARAMAAVRARGEMFALSDERFLELLDWLEPRIPNDVADRVAARLASREEGERP